MKHFFAASATLAVVFSVFPLLFHIISVNTYPGLIGVYFMKISPDIALYIGIIGATSLFLWQILEIRDEKKKNERNQRFYDSYNGFK